MDKMKICYFTVWREDSETVGINMKMKNQVKAFSRLGHDSYFCTSASKTEKLYYYDLRTKKFDLIEEESFTEKSAYEVTKNNFERKISSYFRLKECLKFMDQANETIKFDVIYIRRIMPITETVAFYIKKWSKSGAKIVWEIPTWDSNPKTPYWMLLHAQEKWMYKRLNSYINQIVAISSTDTKADNVLFINNGVDNESIPERKIQKHTSLNLICLATFSYWHGYDRLIIGLKQYYERINNNELVSKNVNVYMVGNGDIQKLKSMVKELSLEEHVFFQGVIVGNSLNTLFNSMDIAIGNLGFHRIGVVSDTSIKIREYCSRSMPFVTGLNVNDYPSDFPYILKVPMDESPIDIEKIIEFYDNLDKEIMLREMREYAESHLTWETQLSKVLKSIQ